MNDRKERRQTVHPEEREKVIANIKPDKCFAKLETKFRDILVDKGVHSQSSLPQRHSMEAIETLAHILDMDTVVQE